MVRGANRIHVRIAVALTCYINMVKIVVLMRIVQVGKLPQKHNIIVLVNWISAQISMSTLMVMNKMATHLPL